MRWLKTYSLITRGAGWLALPAFAVYKRFSSKPDIWRQRLGNPFTQGRPLGDVDLWMHGASVGEMEALWAIASRLLEIRPHTKLVVSTFTTAGLHHAKRISGGKMPVFLCPLDLPQLVEKTVKEVAPKVFCTLETELWPNLLLALKNHGASLLLLNGRISHRSYPSYLRARFLFGQVLQLFDSICAISKVDKERLVSIGAHPSCVKVCGNAKYESLLDKPRREDAQVLTKKLGLYGKRPVIVAGSIREQEHVAIFEAIKKIRHLRPLTILVPRHLDRAKDINTFLEARSAKYATIREVTEASQTSCEDIDYLLVDEMGWLFRLYSICDIAFVGGSIAPLGGQNVMEPAAWAKPVVFGPHTKNFKEATEALIEEQGGFVAKDPDGLGKVFAYLLSDDGLREKAGLRARRALEKLGQGSATSQAQLVAQYLDHKV